MHKHSTDPISVPPIIIVVSFVSAIVMIGISLASSNVLFSLLGSGLTALVSSILLKFNPLDPRVWFSTLGWLYLFAFSVQVTLGFDIGVLIVKTSAITSLFFLCALGAMWIGSAASKKSIATMTDRRKLAKGVVSIVALPVLISLSGALIVHAHFISLAGVTSKRELWEVDAGLPLAGLMSHILLLLGSWLILTSRNRVRAFWITVLVGTVAVYVWGFTGERDVVFKWTLIATFAWFLKDWINVRLILVIGFLMIAVAPIMKDLGVAFSGGDFELARTFNLYQNVLGGEWSAAGSNLDTILRNPSLYENLSLDRFLADLSRGVMPSGFFYGVNTSSWYTQSYTPVVTGRTIPGIGFSLVAACWMYASLIGVIIGGVVFGAVSWWFYRWSVRTPLYASAYFLYVPLALWSLRGDLSFWLSSIIKQVFLPAFLLLVVASFISQTSRKN